MPSRIQKELALLVTGKDVSASRTLRGVNKEMNNLQRVAGKAGTNVARNIERAVVIGAGAAVGAIGYAINAAQDWESAFAGVAKTIDGDVTQIGEGIREMSRTIPVAATELAAIAEAGGALGVAKGDILGFTEVVAKLGVTTDLTTDAAATSLGHLRTTLNLTGDDFEKVGDSLVYLGNHGASTESQILGMAESIAGAAGIMDASTSQVLGWAAAVANTGEETEAGGSSIQRFWLESFKNVEKGGKELELMAEISGTTAAQFKQDFGKDTTGTLAKLVTSMGKLTEAEQLAALEALGFSDIRVTRALLKLMGNTDNLTDSLRDAGDAAGAMGVEAEKRFATTASQVQLLKNNVQDAAVTIGTQLLPMVNELAKEGVDWLKGHQPEIAQFAKDLASGIRDAVQWAKSLDWDSIGAALRTGADMAKLLVNTFLSLPPWLQGGLAGGFAINKFTGGLGTDLIKIAFDQFAGRGSTPAHPLWVQTVGAPLGTPGAAGTAGGGVGSVLKFAAALGLATVALDLWQNSLVPLNQDIAEQTTTIDTQVKSGLATATTEQLRIQERALREGFDKVFGTTAGLGPLQSVLYGGQLEGLKADLALVTAELKRREAGGRPIQMGGKSPDERNAPRAMAEAGILTRATEAGFKPSADAIKATYERNQARILAAQRADATRTITAWVTGVGSIVTAIHGINIPQPQVNVNVTSTDIQRAAARRRRIAKPTGSRGSWFEQNG